jgi:mRNA-degrading endonuclease RelE of RelBE toxin-antitoxin system
VASLALPWFAPPEILSLKVATFKGGRSLRVGEYRVFYDVQEQARLVTVRAIRLKPPHKTTKVIL